MRMRECVMVDSTMVVLPGDLLHVLSTETKLGPGTAVDRHGENPFVSKPGIIRRKGDDRLWVHSQQKRVS